ncbi:DDE-type integrase/transposase/recombinase [Shewanella sp. Isolate13]|uniref:Mu transposase domain-containing protein n=1 Tax=Shewanella sp. Isolate13 TaxID=2908531 RepID=UPI001EFCC238|nr:DDE-type integrase/transposase/recombinase [Shewanella sp. Isolate13]MCG9732322.1 DDE-type integrase/transposase/recombinase [Shewanella sp. Isolate13]
MIATHKFRNVLWHLIFYADYSNRYIATLTRCSHPVVSTIRSKLAKLQLTWIAIKQMSNSELKSVFYPKLTIRKSSKVPPDYAEVLRQKELPRKKQKSLAIQYIEYRIQYGDRAYKQTIFYGLIRAFLKKNNATMTQFYRPGEVMFIDYLGSKAKYKKSGKVIFLPVFVACLGYSKKLFSLATKDMKSESWVQGIVKAFEYFGGVPEVIQFDNAKAMVTTAKLIALLNENARAVSEHYGNICDTSRVGTPKDNANAENTAKIVTTQIIAPMSQDITFFSEDEVNAYLFTEVERLNHQPFQKHDYSRQDLFEEKEKQALMLLPAKPFTPFIHAKSCHVPATYLVEHNEHRYSVPYTLIGEKVHIRITLEEIIVVSEDKEVARHSISDEKGGVSIEQTHMKPSHLAEQRKSMPIFMAWAKEIGQDAEHLIEKQYAKTSNPNSRVIGKRCTALQKLEAKVGSEIFLSACRYVLEREAEDLFSPTDIELVIRAKAYEYNDVPQDLLHANVRGSQYFEGDRHEH